MAIVHLLSLLTDLWKRFDDYILDLRLHFGHTITDDAQRRITRIFPNQVVKGPCTQQEVEGTLFAAQHAALHSFTPRIHRIHERRDGRAFIIMEFVEGENLLDVWPRLDDVGRRDVVKQLWRNLQQLRACVQPVSASGVLVGSAISGSEVRDGSYSLDPFGPFWNLEGFNRLQQRNPNLQRFSRFWTPVDKRAASTVFTHGDMALRNVIVRQDGSLCLIDWEAAGWWPEYWEMCKWHFGDWPRLPGWVDLMDEVSGLNV
ncbi:kinase-like domain-containing protein [Neohortaea acidophila]|uniref:Kinase-like domain-containing protein n=1 Tax=Neohortaea acidophila TaxID=245834 RepID=A0A6A6Q263_9PEZI|nr:kinase-like domain-containing protein [Neohortaea acidophila]KAF2486342.1 kinase-like domain-containing protein [Neohortaea acidophila]